MKPNRSYLLFRQSFKIPLHTAKGFWKDRTSLILCEDNGSGNISFGEVAPLPGHLDQDLKGAEEEAKVWIRSDKPAEEFKSLLPAIQSLKSSIWREDTILDLPKSSKLWGLTSSLSAGVIKRKIGLLPHKEEIPSILEWLNKLPRDVQVRLDPNESFSRDDLLHWTDALHKTSSIQYIEQPTGAGDDEWLIEHSMNSPIPIALDEALIRMSAPGELFKIPANLFLVIKPTLFNCWKVLDELFSDHQRKIIFSTVFESPFGFEALIRLCSKSSLAPGLERNCYYGNRHEFPEHHLPKLTSPAVHNLQLASLWNSLAS